MNCYLCSGTDFIQRKGQVRDAPELMILECKSCRLVTLSSMEHINAEHYEKSGMHGDKPLSIESLLNETAVDDQRRFEMLRSILHNKKVLDFGCGQGGFLKRAKRLTAEVKGIELEKRVRDYWQGDLQIFPELSCLGGEHFDLITAFHVVEHLPDPRRVLREIKEVLAPNGRIVIEVPSSLDALLNLYECEPFQQFTYWSQHLYLFNAETLETLASQAGLRVIVIEQFQRYPLSNHLYWLSRGKPGGHKFWSFLDSPLLQQAYADSLARVGQCDTLIAHFEFE